MGPQPGSERWTVSLSTILLILAFIAFVLAAINRLQAGVAEPERVDADIDRQ